MVPEGIGSIHDGEIYTQYGTWATKTVSRVRAELAPNLRFAHAGDLVIAAVGETVDDVLRPSRGSAMRMLQYTMTASSFVTL